MIKIVNYQRENVKTTPLRRQRIRETKYLKEASDCSKGHQMSLKIQKFSEGGPPCPSLKGRGTPPPIPTPSPPSMGSLDPPLLQYSRHTCIGSFTSLSLTQAGLQGV